MTDSFNLALSRYVRAEANLDFDPEVRETWFTEPSHGTCGEGTCWYDYPARFTIAWVRPGTPEDAAWTEHHVDLGHDDTDGFGDFVRRLVEQ